MTPVICTVDVVLLCLKEGALQVALFKRDREPFMNELSLPGGYIHAEEDEDAYAAAERVLREKTGISSPYLEQLATFTGVQRDPRGWSASIAYYALVSTELVEQGGSPDLQFVNVNSLKALPFDHLDIIQTAVHRVRSKSSYSSLPVYLCGKQFTLSELRSVYEALMGESIDKVSFRRKMATQLDIIEPIEGAFETGKANRPAQLYRIKRKYRHKLYTVDRAFNA